MNRVVRSRKKQRRRSWTEYRKDGDGSTIATYSRNSKGKPNGASTEAQEEQHKPVILSLNPSTVHHFIDEGISGTDFNTRQINKILALKRSGKIRVVVCASIDRLGREAFGLLGIVQDWRDGLIATSEKIFDCSKLDDLAEILERIISACRQLINTSNYTDIAIKQHWNKGEYSKRVPFAYIRRKDRWIQIVPELVAVVRKIYALYKKLGRLNAVRRLVYKKYGRLLKGIEKKYPQLKGNLNLSDDRIRTILTDPVYIGKPVNRGILKVDPSLRMVSDKDFKACQKILRLHDQKRTAPGDRALNKAFAEKPLIALKVFGDFIDTRRLYHVGCPGKLRLNGNAKDGRYNQSVLQCQYCNTQPRLPNAEQWRRIKQHANCSICEMEVKESQVPVVCGCCASKLSRSFRKPIGRLAEEKDGGNHRSTVLSKEDSIPNRVQSMIGQTKKVHVRSNAKRPRNVRHKKPPTRALVVKKCAERGELVTAGYYSSKFAGKRKFYCHNCYNRLNMRLVKGINPRSYRGAYRSKRSNQSK